MLKKLITLLLISLIIPSINAEPIDNGGHAGTPPGFYDDINPNSLYEEEEKEEIKPSENMQPESEEIIIPPSYDKTKPTKNYADIYNSLEIPNFSYLHDIDPDQYYDMKDTTWSVYPLFRLISPIYFKTITIEPGYYLLTPREQDGKWYILFKQNGVVKHIIPVYERDYTPEMFYDKHIPKPKLTTAQKIHIGFLDFIGNFKSTKRKSQVQTYLEVNDLENYFVSIVIYYGPHKYSTIFRTIKL